MNVAFSKRRASAVSLGELALAGVLGASTLVGAASATGAPSATGVPGPPAATPAEIVAVKAGTIYVVEDGRVLEGGATILIKDGKIQAVGKDVVAPPGARVVDYGPDAVIVPGLVAPYSGYALGSPSPWTASPGVRAVDAFDPYGSYTGALAGGVTSTYITPAEGRLIGGTGALVKLGGDGDRVVNAAAAIHGAIDESARNTDGYWQPPIPATVDTGMNFARPQLPRTTMGAIVALNELVTAARADEVDPELAEIYGPETIDDLARLVAAATPWRIAATEENEIRAALDFAKAANVELVLDKAYGAKALASEIAEAGVSVVFRVPFVPNAASGDYGKDRDARWPDYDVPSALVDAGVRVAIGGVSPSDLLFGAALASRGGLDPAAALRAVTLTPAQICGAADRVGSLRAGKDADLCVLNGEPFEGYASVVATWIDGEPVWSAHTTSTATVLEVDELFVGDGTVMRPGQVLLRDGRIVEVAERVAHPRGAKVVRGKAAMPGMIDAFGHLGLEGSQKVPSTDFKLSSIVGPGDDVDRRVAARGITTVVLTPRSASGSGAPVMAYKPAASDLERQIVGDPVALRVTWKAPNRLDAGDSVRDLLAKGADYAQKWKEYEEAMAKWTPPPPEPPKEEAEDAKDKADDEKKDEAEDDEKADDKKSKKKKKKEMEPDPITGSWSGTIGGEDDDEDGTSIKLRLLFEAGEGSGEVEGNLRAPAVSSDLVGLIGSWDREGNELSLTGLGSKGWASVSAKIDEEKLVGKISVANEELEFTAERTAKEYVVAKRPERRKVEEEKEREPKGQPKMPRVDPRLEPIRSAIAGNLTMVVEVDREDEILDCVEAFAKFGIRPVLYGAEDAHYVADEIASRIAGVLLSPRIRIREPKRGIDYRTPYADLQGAGIRVAFHSDAEEGSIDLPIAAAYAVANGMSPVGALRALTSDAAAMMSIEGRVGALRRGLDADVLLLDGPPLAPGTSVLRAWVDGEEVH